MSIIRLSLLSPRTLWKWIHGLGGPGLILLGFADNAPFISSPAGSVDVLVILLASHGPTWWAYYASMATIGEVAGGYVTYRVAEKGGEKALERKLGKSRTEQIYQWFQKRGIVPVVVVGAMLPPPFPFTPVLMAAGIMHYPQNKFLPCLVIGRALRFFALAYLGRVYGHRVIELFSRFYRPALYALIASAIVGCLAALLYFKRYKTRSQHSDHGRD